MGKPEIVVFLEGKTDWAVLCKLGELGILKSPPFQIRFPGGYPYDQECVPYHGGISDVIKALEEFVRGTPSVPITTILIRDMDRGQEDHEMATINIYWGKPDFAREEWGFEEFTLEDHLLFCIESCQKAFEKKWPEGVIKHLDEMKERRGQKGQLECSEEVLGRLRRELEKSGIKKDEVNFYLEILETANCSDHNVLEEAFAAIVDKWPKPRV